MDYPFCSAQETDDFTHSLLQTFGLKNHPTHYAIELLPYDHELHNEYGTCHLPEIGKRLISKSIDFYHLIFEHKKPFQNKGMVLC